MAVASGPAGLVLAGPVLAIAFTPAHAQVIKRIQGSSSLVPRLSRRAPGDEATNSLCVCHAGLGDALINRQLQRYELVSHAVAATDDDPNVTGGVV